jgi:glycosyltransferase involved in cell wall biosynthesis
LIPRILNVSLRPTPRLDSRHPEAIAPTDTLEVSPKLRSNGSKLKVLFLSTRDWYDPAAAGGDTTMWENARYLASVGHEVTFVAATYPKAAHEETIDGIKVVRSGGIHSLWWRSFVFYLTRGGRDYDVVVSEGFGGSRIPRLAPLYAKQPLITEWHQIYRDLFAVQYPKLLNGPLNLLERFTAWVHRNTLVRAGTQEWKQSFPNIGFKPENVLLIPVSIRDDWLEESNGGPSTEPTILWLGKLRRYKCPDHIIRAMPAVISQIPSARLIIAGRRDDHGYEKELRELSRRLDIEDHVDFRFDLSDSEKRGVIHQSRVLVISSPVEGFGIVALEANACGVPVIASSGVPEGAVREGFNGVRYQFGDTKALTEAIVRMMNDSELYSNLSRNALANVGRFRWSRVGAEFEAAVIKLAAG